MTDASSNWQPTTDTFIHKCISDDYCESPCVPVGSEVVSLDPAFTMGSELEFACSDTYFTNGTTTRTCMVNKKWDGRNIDCLGNLCSASRESVLYDMSSQRELE